MKTLSNKISEATFNKFNSLSKELDLPRATMLERAIIRYLDGFDESEARDVMKLQQAQTLEKVKALNSKPSDNKSTSK